MLPNEILVRVLQLTGAGLVLVASLSAQEDTRAPMPRAFKQRVVLGEHAGPGEMPRVFHFDDGDGAHGEMFVGAAPHDGPRLGIEYEQTPDGMRVVSVDEGSLAASAGLQAGDLLMRIGELRIADASDVARALRKHAPNSLVPIHVVREGQGMVSLEGTLPPPPPPRQPPLADGARGGFLGVELQTGSEGAEDTDQGVLVKGVVPESAAWFAGLAPGDRLLAINDQSVSSGKDVVGTISSSEPGTMVDLRYRRGGDVLMSKVRLGSRAPAGGPMSWTFDGGQGLPMMLRDGQAHRIMPDMSQLHGLLPRLREMQFFGGMEPGPNMRQRLRLPDGDGNSSLHIEIRDGRMTVDRDGQVKHYERGADGRWMTGDGEPLDVEMQIEVEHDTNGPRTREG